MSVMKLHFCIMISLLLLLFGCGGAADDVPTAEPEYLTVIDLEENERVIPRTSLVNPRTGDPAVQQVLSIDRQTGQETWVPVEELLAAPPVTARYIPLTRPASEVEQ